MKSRLFGSFLIAFALLGSTYVELPSAQSTIQRGYGPTITAGSGGALAGISSVLTVSTTSAQTAANTTETDLWTYSLPANTLSADGYTLRITGTVSYAANANGKTLRLRLGAAGSITLNTSANGGSDRFDVTITRTGASAQLYTYGKLRNGGTVGEGFGTFAEDTTTALALKITGQNGTASAGDIVFRFAMVEFLRAGA